MLEEKWHQSIVWQERTAFYYSRRNQCRPWLKSRIHPHKRGDRHTLTKGPSRSADIPDGIIAAKLPTRVYWKGDGAGRWMIKYR